MALSEPGQIPGTHNARGIPIWRDERFLRLVAQFLSVIVVVGLLYWSLSNILNAANQRGLGLGFNFLGEAAGFSISESVIPYDASSTFATALWVGILNTIRVSAIGVIIATILGFIVGVALLSSNWLVSLIARIYVEAHRNIPLLVLLFLWYRGVFAKLPGVKESITLPGPVYINQRGIFTVWPNLIGNGWIFIASLGVGLVIAVLVWLWLRKIRVETGRSTHFNTAGLSVFLAAALIGWLLAGGRPFEIDFPQLQGFNFQGGMHMTPEFFALLVGLSTYTASFIAEIVRAGIQAVSRGQVEAAHALGLHELPTLNLIVMPQALRIIIPPLISQYLNLTKNSSLAVFLGFPELFSIGKTVINQAGRAVPVFVFIMAAYLIISLATSLVLNIYNRRVQFLEK